MKAQQGGAPLQRTTLSVLTTFPIFYTIFMRNHSIIIGNVAEGSATWDQPLAGKAALGRHLWNQPFQAHVAQLDVEVIVPDPEARLFDKDGIDQDISEPHDRDLRAANVHTPTFPVIMRWCLIQKV